MEGEEGEVVVEGTEGGERKLGRLFFTIKYSFEKNALIVTVNKCTNLPAKDAQNKSRYEMTCILHCDRFESPSPRAGS